MSANDLFWLSIVLLGTGLSIAAVLFKNGLLEFWDKKSDP